MAQVLVTGASGRAGRHVVAGLLARGHTVRGVFRTAPGCSPDVEWRRADLAHSASLGSLLQGCDAVIHLAAELRDRSSMDAANVDATRRLVAAAERSGAGYFGYASSIVIYGSPRTCQVDERTPRLDPFAPMAKQYYAEPYMLDYARTKAAGEVAIEALSPRMTVDFYRPGVVVTQDDILQCANWSRTRKIVATYRRTQFVTASDTAAAIVHLMERGLAASPRTTPKIDAYNLVDDEGTTYRTLLADVYRVTRDRQFKPSWHVPVLLDMAKDLARHRTHQIRYPLGMLRVSNDKLRSTDFTFPVGLRRALLDAIAHR